MIIFITTFKANYYGTKTTGKPAGVAEKCKIGMPMVATIATISRRTTRIPMQAKRPSLRVDKKKKCYIYYFKKQTYRPVPQAKLLTMLDATIPMGLLLGRQL